MQVFPKAIEIGDLDGFTPENDIFGRSDLGRRMSHMVATVTDPLVIAFDGVWGSGKTTFLKAWAGELRKSGHPVILFDTFENDYVEDAFGALARELVEHAEATKSRGSKVAKSIRKKAGALGSVLLRASLKTGAKVAVRALTANLMNVEDFKEFREVVQGEAEGAAEAYMEQLLDQPRKQKQTAVEFRAALAELPSLLSPPKPGEKQKPLIFIIDELDRCKPLFALALLERIKHFMAVPNVHFVLGVNLPQLETSVKFAYGEVDASAYLQKFISLTVQNIDINAERTNSELGVYAGYLITSLGLQDGNHGALSAMDAILRLTKLERMSFRTLERIFTILVMALELTPGTQTEDGVIGGLVMMKVLRPELFRKAKQGILDLSEVKEFLRFSPEGSDISWEEKLWTYLLTGPLPGEPTTFEEYVYLDLKTRDERRAFISHRANNMLDRLGP